MIRLGVNIDHVATLRQARGTRYPDPIAAAAFAEEAGADHIVVHLREDRRHIQEQDLWTLRKTLRTGFNLEMACTEEILTIAETIRPEICTFVPERRAELTTEGGLCVARNTKILRKAIDRLHAKSIRVSLFIDPECPDIDIARQLEVALVELHTGAYCDATTPEQTERELARLRQAAAYAHDLGLTVAAGHGLNYENIRPVIKQIPQVVEYNIGHSIIARALFVGIHEAVNEMRKVMSV